MLFTPEVKVRTVRNVLEGSTPHREAGRLGIAPWTVRRWCKDPTLQPPPRPAPVTVRELARVVEPPAAAPAAAAGAPVEATSAPTEELGEVTDAEAVEGLCDDARDRLRGEALSALAAGMAVDEVKEALGIECWDLVRGKRGGYPDEIRRAYALRWAKGEPAHELARELGCDRSNLTLWASKLRIPMQGRKLRRSRYTVEQRDEAMRWLEAGKTPTEIASRMRVHRNTIYKWVNQAAAEVSVAAPAQRVERGLVARVDALGAANGAPLEPPVALEPPRVSVRDWANGASAAAAGSGPWRTEPTPWLATAAPGARTESPLKIRAVTSYACPHCLEPIELPVGFRVIGPDARPPAQLLMIERGRCPRCAGEIEL